LWRDVYLKKAAVGVFVICDEFLQGGVRQLAGLGWLAREAGLGARERRLVRRCAGRGVGVKG